MRRVTVLPLLALTLAVGAWAQPRPGPPAGGIHGRIEAGAGAFWTTDQLAASGKNRHTGGLDAPSDPFVRALPVGLFDLRWAVPGAGVTLHAGTPLETEGPPGLTLGAEAKTRAGSLDLSGVWQPFRRVWKDPYRETEAREKTPAPTYGLRLRWGGLVGSAWSAEYRVTWSRVEDDQAGGRFEELRRDAVEHAAHMERAIPLGRATRLVPSAGYAWRRADGAAEQSQGPRLGLSFRRFTRAYTLILTATLKWDAYADDHPVFGARRRDLTYGAFGVVSVPIARGPRYFTSLLAGAFRRESNIAFLDATSLLGGVTLGVRF